MVPKQPTNQPTDRRAGHNQPTNKLRRVSENDRKLKKRFRFQLSPCEKQSCSLLCHCKAVRNTLTNTQVPQTSKTRPHARNNWGTWRGHNNQLWMSLIVVFVTFASTEISLLPLGRVSEGMAYFLRQTSLSSSSVVSTRFGVQQKNKIGLKGILWSANQTSLESGSTTYMIAYFLCSARTASCLYALFKFQVRPTIRSFGWCGR